VTPIEADLEEIYLSFWLSKTREYLTVDNADVQRLLGRESPEALADRLVSGTGLADPARRAEFAAYIRRFWPGLPDGALTPDYAGIRPKLHGPGEPQPDFQLDGPEAHRLLGLIALFGIESPGLTSSLAIGEAVAERLVHG
jgi:L-2-hydroxyglutarate oxidase LhgO